MTSVEKALSADTPPTRELHLTTMKGQWDGIPYLPVAWAWRNYHLWFTDYTLSTRAPSRRFAGITEVKTETKVQINGWCTPTHLSEWRHTPLPRTRCDYISLRLKPTSPPLCWSYVRGDKPMALAPRASLRRYNQESPSPVAAQILAQERHTFNAGTSVL